MHKESTSAKCVIDTERKTMKITGTIAAALLASTFMLGLTACDDQGPLEEAGEEVDEAVEDTGDAIEDATDGN